MFKRLALLILFGAMAALAVPYSLKLNLPERAQVSFQEQIPKDATSLRIAFKVPDDLPKGLFLSVFAKDQDALWRQIRVPFPASCKITVPLAGGAAAQAWQCHGHQRPWNCLTRPVEYGVIVELDTGDQRKYSGEIQVVEVAPVVDKGFAASGKLMFLNQTQEVRQGDVWEASFALDCWPKAPFDLEKTSLVAKITAPDGAIHKANAFYYEPFLYDEEEWDKTKCLLPWGAPCFKVRYCPEMPGVYKVALNGEIDGSKLALGNFAFTATPNPDYHGVLQVDERHRQYLKYSDGTPFTGIGMNVRSPYDNRYREVAPYSPWLDQGLSMYPRLFRKYKECGINVVEVWMCSWWLALEWIPDAPGFHGVGHYNQYRAWMLDYIMGLAKENGIKIILVINNHGKVAMHFDTEWKRNPYNKINGGYLDKCEEYYTDARARADTKKLLDYIAARWSAYPNLLAWKLFTELDLTGPDIEYYKRTPTIAEWHREMAEHFKSVDRYQHPVTTHWMLGYYRIDERTANVSQLDFLTTDVYYNLGAGTKGMFKMMDASRDFAIRHKKPLIITEYGGSSYADSMESLVKQVPSGIWCGYFNEMGIVPMYWWFALVEDRNLYRHYAALSRYAQGEDRRFMSRQLVPIPETRLEMRALVGKGRTLAWIYDTDYFYSQKENAMPALHEKRQASIPVSFQGRCRVEYWDANAGEIKAAIEAEAANGKVLVTLPAFSMHCAVKVAAL
ncbi:MAG: cellulase family glycosylhydrolase [Victivallales bacterium]|nr:cellulase family glycosylhydrolase [Victivallales bacterium]